jgi:hypothetical protein
MSENYPAFLSPEWLTKHKREIIAASVVVAALFITWLTLTWAQNIHNEGFKRQRQVSQQYNNYQTSLSTCLNTTDLSTQMASAEYAQFKDVMTAIISARYQTPDGQPTTADGVLGDGALISALQENYPDVDRSLWKQALATAVGCRNQVAGEMAHLQQVSASFDTWANTGNPISKHYRNNWPNDQLKVQGLLGELTGQDALDFLTQPVLTTSATQAIRTHTMPDQPLFPSSSSSPSP